MLALILAAAVAVGAPVAPVVRYVDCLHGRDECPTLETECSPACESEGPSCTNGNDGLTPETPVKSLRRAAMLGATEFRILPGPGEVCDATDNSYGPISGLIVGPGVAESPLLDLHAASFGGSLRIERALVGELWGGLADAADGGTTIHAIDSTLSTVQAKSAAIERSIVAYLKIGGGEITASTIYYFQAYCDPCDASVDYSIRGNLFVGEIVAEGGPSDEENRMLFMGNEFPSSPPVLTTEGDVRIIGSDAHLLVP